MARRPPPRHHRPEPARPRPGTRPPQPLIVEREGPAPASGSCVIVYRDEQMVVVDKGPNLLTVPPDQGNPPTVMSLLHLRLRGAHDRLFAVHRLDRDTSGVLVVARTRRALDFLVRELAARHFERIYLSLVEGRPPPAGTLSGHLASHGKDIRMRSVGEGLGERAVTHFRVVEQAGAIALVAFKLETGRRNQIRVQMAELGHPLVGEVQYAEGLPERMRRQALHSHRLRVPHPDGTRLIEAVSPMPPDMLDAWARAGGRHGPVLRASFEIPGPDAPVFQLLGRGTVEERDVLEALPPPPKKLDQLRGAQRPRRGTPGRR